MDDAQPLDVQESPSQLTASAIARSADRQEGTSTIHLVLLETLLTTSTTHMLKGSLSHTAPLSNISGRMPQDSLIAAIGTAPVLSLQVEIPLTLLGRIFL